MIKRMPCVTCGGSGWATGGPGMVMTCPTCHGAGSIPDAPASISDIRDELVRMNKTLDSLTDWVHTLATRGEP